MTTETLNLTVDRVRRAGVVNVTSRGIPLSIVDTPAGVKAFVSVCPHEWIVMEEPFMAGNCLVCPLHAVSFDGCSGAVVNARGRNVPEGLLEAPVEIDEGLVAVHLSRRHYVYLAAAHLRRAIRTLVGRGKRRTRKLKAR